MTCCDVSAQPESRRVRNGVLISSCIYQPRYAAPTRGSACRYRLLWSRRLFRSTAPMQHQTNSRPTRLNQPIHRQLKQKWSDFLHAKDPVNTRGLSAGRCCMLLGSCQLLFHTTNPQIANFRFLAHVSEIFKLGSTRLTNLSAR